MRKLLLILAVMANYTLAINQTNIKTPTMSYVGAPALGDAVISASNAGPSFTAYGLFVSAIYGTNKPCVSDQWGNIPYPSILNDDNVGYMMSPGVTILGTTNSTPVSVPIFMATGLYNAIWTSAMSTTGGASITPQSVLYAKIWLVTNQIPSSGVTPSQAGVICNGDTCYKNITLPLAKAIFTTAAATKYPTDDQCVPVSCDNTTQMCQISKSTSLYLRK